MELFNYSLIRAVPDHRRGEWVNIGVCVYRQGYLDIRLADSMAKVKSLNPNIDSGFYRDIPQYWNSIVDGVNDATQQQVILGSLQIAHASPMAQFLTSNDKYEDQIQSILCDLVVAPVAKRVKNEPRLRATLKSHLIKAKLYSDDLSAIKEHKVVSHFPIKAEANLFADFAAKNGVMHITETIDFRVKAEQLRNRHGHAAIKSITLDVAGDIFPNCNRHVVYAYHVKDSDVIEASLNLLQSYSMRMFNAGDKQQLAEYVEITAAALKQKN